MTTRTVEECQDLAAAWLAGKKKKVIEELGGEPTAKFLEDFGGWRGDDPHKVYDGARRFKAKPIAEVIEADSLKGPVDGIEITREPAKKAPPK